MKQRAREEREERDSPVGAPSIICLDWMPAWYWEHSLINIQDRVEGVMLDELASFPLRFSDLLLSLNSQTSLVEVFKNQNQDYSAEVYGSAVL